MTDPVNQANPADSTPTVDVGGEVTTHVEDADAEQFAGEALSEDPGVVAEMAALDDDSAADSADDAAAEPAAEPGDNEHEPGEVQF